MASREQRFLGRRMPGTIKVEKAEGSFIFDNQGRKYIDFVMGWCVGKLRLGQCGPALDIDQAVAKQGLEILEKCI